MMIKKPMRNYLINEAYAKIMDDSTHQHAWNTYPDKKTQAKEVELKKNAMGKKIRSI